MSSAKVLHLLHTGDAFAWDSGAYEGGDTLYAEVIAITSRGYSVRVRHVSDHHGVIDHYAFGFIDEVVRLSPEQMQRARRDGYPCERRYLDALVGGAS